MRKRRGKSAHRVKFPDPDAGPRPQWRPTGRVKPLASTDDSPASAVGGAAVAADDGLPMIVMERPPCPQCSLEDGDVGSGSEKAVTTFQPGDSYWGGSDPEVVSDDEAAVAADDAPPKERVRRRSARPPRDTAPTKLKAKWAGRNNADHVGNIGWLFLNWGKRPANMKMREHFDEVLKKHPAMVIGLAECQEDSEEVLKRLPAPVKPLPPGVKRTFKDRQEYQYMTWRHPE